MTDIYIFDANFMVELGGCLILVPARPLPFSLKPL